MFGFINLILFYFVWKKFSKLALLYKKSKHNGWLGIATYIFGAILFGFLLKLLNDIFGWNIWDKWKDNQILKILDFPIGLLSCFIGYNFFERKWKSDFTFKKDLIDEIDNISQE